MQIVTDTLRVLMPYYPQPIREQIDGALDAIGLEAVQLAAEVMRAERDGIPFHDAANRVDFTLLARVHHGTADLLQRRIPLALRGALRGMGAAARNGAFEHIRRATFLRALGDGPEAALLRFLIYQAARLNLLVLTWDDPSVEVLGSLARIDREAESIVRQLLAQTEIAAPDVRPLHILVAELAVRMTGDIREVMSSVARMDRQRDAVSLLEQMIDATRLTRSLEGADAAIARSSTFDDDLGSQEIADRYPWHFRTAAAVDQRRSRLRRQLSGARPLAKQQHRMIDLIQDIKTEVGS